MLTINCLLSYIVMRIGYHIKLQERAQVEWCIRSMGQQCHGCPRNNQQLISAQLKWSIQLLDGDVAQRSQIYYTKADKFYYLGEKIWIFMPRTNIQRSTMIMCVQLSMEHKLCIPQRFANLILQARELMALVCTSQHDPFDRNVEVKFKYCLNLDYTHLGKCCEHNCNCSSITLKLGVG